MHAFVEFSMALLIPLLIWRRMSLWKLEIVLVYLYYNIKIRNLLVCAISLCSCCANVGFSKIIVSLPPIISFCWTPKRVESSSSNLSLCSISEPLESSSILEGFLCRLSRVTWIAASSARVRTVIESRVESARLRFWRLTEVAIGSIQKGHLIRFVVIEILI